MKMLKKTLIACGLVVTPALSGCILKDDNESPVYSKENGLPVNCRAFIQYAIDEYRAGKYSANDTFLAIERNCGKNGWSWKNIREQK